ncbi:hypothetical protein CYMTET_6116 [Cymbomonas tetramitiformis]|uniref:Myb-binding protein 1A n=1 Tax=Cymbomonas tetramitiformis TaxID=36881 RepID=A0AAE0LIU0_9CHLO|nr:hypothetical protein CYMTET_6116 [Cymbomonas tetramitiformis]
MAKPQDAPVGEEQDGAKAVAASNARSIDSSVLQLFWDLAALESSRRQAATEELVKYLCAAQAAHDQENGTTEVPTPPDSASDKEKAEAAVAPCAPQVAYALRRLTRGLSSGREGARQGFAMSLAAVLSSLPCIAMTLAPALLAVNLEPVTGAAKAQEANDIHMGRLFGLGAVALAVQRRQAGAGKLKKAASVQLQAKIIEQVVVVAKSKSFLLQAGAAIVTQILKGYEGSMGELLEEAPTLAEWLKSDPSTATPETLMLLLTMRPQLPAAFAKECPLLPSGDAGEGDEALFAPEHLTKWTPLLKATTAYHPRLHSLWGILLGMLVPGLDAQAAATAKKPRKPNKARPASKAEGAEGAEGEEQDGADDEKEQPEGPPAANGKEERPRLTAIAETERFWEEVVEGSMVHSSHERKYLSMELFSLLLPHMPGTRVSALFSHSFMKLLVNNMSAKDNFLHKRSMKCAYDIVQFVITGSASPEAKVAITASLQQYGGGRFDQLTGTATVASLLATQDTSSVNLHVKRLMVTFCRPLEASGAAPREDDGVDAAVAATGKRMWAIEQLGAVWKSKSGDQAVQLAIMRFLLVHCAFSVHGDPKPMEQELQIDGGLPSPELPENVRERCGQRLLQLMASATNQYVNKARGPQGNKGKEAKAEKYAEQQGKEVGVDMAGILFAYCTKLERHTKSAQLVRSLSEADTATREQAAATVADVQTQAEEAAAEGGVDAMAKAAKLRSFGGMLQLLLFHQLVEPEGGYAPLLEELPVVFHKFSDPTPAPPPHPDDEPGMADPHFMDVLMDVLLALLARPSAPLRDAAERVFRGWVNDVTGTGVKDMLRVLDKKGKRQRLRARGSKRKGKNSEGDVVEREGSGDERDDDIDDDSDDSDEDVLSDEDEEDEEEEEEEEEEVEDEDEDEEEAEAPSLVPRPGPGDGVDKANGEEEEEDMDDEAMFKMDALLGAAYQSNQKEKQREKQKAETLMHFKFRVCTLLEIYVKKVPGSAHLASMVAPLLRALKAAEAPEPHGGHHLVKRISALITSGVCKGRDRPTEGGEGMPVDSLVQQLKKCSRLASRSSSKPVCGAAAACCTFIMRQISAAAPEGNPEASACLGQMLKEYFERKTCRLPRSFFETTAWRVPWAPAVLLPIITAATTGARNDYLQVESAVMLAAALKPLEGKPAKVTAVVKRHMDPLGRALLGLLKTKFGKAARRTEALKAVCGVLERLPRVFEGQKVSALMDGEVLVALEDAAAELVAGGEGAQAPKKLTSSLTRLQVILGTHQAGKGKKRPEAPTQSTPKADKRQKTESEAPKTPKTPKRRKDDVSTVAEKGTSEKAKSTTKKQKKEK